MINEFLKKSHIKEQFTSYKKKLLNALIILLCKTFMDLESIEKSNYKYREKSLKLQNYGIGSGAVYMS